ncbi:MAG TPA: hypothetical protein VFX84_00340, partial [Candidatus Saccharimonadales bacterium]|nr:hypothetical protein [Candidatus Saccharimonadales bacterium]
MTRFLSEALKAEEPFFRLALQSMEAVRGHRNTDIRFSIGVRHEARKKLRELGLDPDDTTPPELYHVLQERLKSDDLRLTRRLRTLAATHVSAEAEVVSGMVHALRELPDSKGCFALKNSSLRAIFRKLPPKKAMKRLGYRSLDSFLKHEDPVSVLAAAFLSEGITWQHKLLEQYKRLTPSDFENRDIRITRPDSARWRQLAASSVNRKRHNILCFKEAGALVLLPLPEDAPPGAVTASLALALHELNRIRSGSTFLKLCQVRPDFGNLVKTVASDEPSLAVRLFDQPVSWQLIQRYYSELTEKFREAVFEPHVRLEDMAWHSVEESLGAIDPDLGFWKNSAHLGLLHQHEPVSMNIVDTALNYCNGLPF